MFKPILKRIRAILGYKEPSSQYYDYILLKKLRERTEFKYFSESKPIPSNKGEMVSFTHLFSKTYIIKDKPEEGDLGKNIDLKG